MKNIFLALGIMLSLTACRLDDNLFNPSQIDEYKFDDYEGDLTFRLADSYDIPEDKIHLFTLTSNDEEAGEASIYAVYLGDLTNIATDTVIMYCHGNAAHMDVYWERAKLLANAGGKNRFGVLMIDYRGYGLSEGKSTESTLYNDVDAALDWLKTNGLTDDRLVIYGFSLGSAPSTELTANPRSMQPSKLILEAPFASAEVMLQDASLLALPSTYITNLKIDNAEEIKKIEEPFLWLHGEADDFLRISTHGSVVAQNYQGVSKTEVRIKGAGHGTVPNTLGFEKYMNTIETFLTE